MCHQCGYAERRPDSCSECGTFDNLTPCGPGVERIAEEVAELFPDKRVIVLSSDFPGGAERLRAELQTVAEGACDIVIGTQLVAKGHNFPHLTLVGVLDADIGLTSGDPRAAERTFQLLQQVTGRAGRGEKPGRALLQTYQPDHPVIAALLSGIPSASTRRRSAPARPPGCRPSDDWPPSSSRPTSARWPKPTAGAGPRRRAPRGRDGAGTGGSAAGADPGALPASGCS